MKISIIQMNTEFKDNEKNYIRAEKLIKNAALEKPDVIILPETWSTGFFPQENLLSYSENNAANLKSIFSKLSLENNTNIIAGSIVNKKEDGIYNTCLVFNRKGQNIEWYDKIHLFSPMNEDKFFKSGNRVATFNIDGISCAVVICYDIRFPELIRTLALRGIEVLFVVAQWPKARVEHWKLLNRVRAIENQIFVVAVNSCGVIDDLKFAGNSLVIDPWGEIIGELSSEEEIKTFEIDIKKVKEIRERMNIFNDRKADLYKID